MSCENLLCDVISHEIAPLPFEPAWRLSFLDEKHILGWQRKQDKQGEISTEISSRHGKIKLLALPRDFDPIGKLHDGRTLIGYLKDPRDQVVEDELWVWNSHSRKAPQRYLHLNKKPKSKFYTEVSS
jgi:hypothetical protein